MQTPEEHREALLRAMLNPNAVDGTSFDYSMRRAKPYLERIFTYLDLHQPLTAKLLREGDPEGPLADALKYGLTPHKCSPKPSYGVHPLINANYRINYPEPTERTEAEKS